MVICKFSISPRSINSFKPQNRTAFQVSQTNKWTQSPILKLIGQFPMFLEK